MHIVKKTKFTTNTTIEFQEISTLGRNTLVHLKFYIPELKKELNILKLIKDFKKHGI
jgi:hypothetical protein